MSLKPRSHSMFEPDERQPQPWVDAVHSPHGGQADLSNFENPSSGKNKLRIGTANLSAAEAGLVRAFVQMSTNLNDKFPWTFATHRPFDAVVTDYDTQQQAGMTLHDLPRSILFLSDQSVPNQRNILPRPLRFRA